MAVLKIFDGTNFILVPTGALDAALVRYTPAVLTDWDGDADPGETDDALDQLAERTDDLEGGSAVTTANVDAAGAVMETDFGTAPTILAANTTDTPTRILVSAGDSILGAFAASTIAWEAAAANSVLSKFNAVDVLAFNAASASTFFGRTSSSDLEFMSAANARSTLGIVSASKDADTDIANDATVNDDPDLTVAVAASTTYMVLGNIMFLTGTTADFRFTFTFPSADCDIWMMGSRHDTAGAVRAWHVETSGTEFVQQAVAVDENFHVMGRIKINGSAGNLLFRWAQRVSNATTTSVLRGSWLWLIPIG